MTQSAASSSASECTRRAVVLPAVLVLISLLALVLGSYLFYVQAETSGANAYSDAQQARLAAESGFEDVTALLRDKRHDARSWFDVQGRWRHGLVWSPSYDRQSDPVRKSGSRQELLAEGTPAPAWRYSVVAANLDGPEGTMRFGLTPEAGKLNLNTASEEQLRKLLLPLLAELGLENGPDLLNALLDWRDGDDEAREGGAENEYYNTLTPPYKCKNGKFDTIEELLLVKGWSAVLIWGEDVNRNGILDRNEDDGDASEPKYDNGDGVLNHGVAPFLTVFTREPDTALDNKPRINLNADAAIVAAMIAQQFQEGEISPETIAFIQQLKQQNFNFGQLRSPADLMPGGEETAEGESNEAAGGDDGGGRREQPDGESNGESGAPDDGAAGGIQPRPRGPFAQITPAGPGRGQDPNSPNRGGGGARGGIRPGTQDPNAPNRGGGGRGGGGRGGLRPGGGDTPPTLGDVPTIPQPPRPGGGRGGRGGQRAPSVAEAMANSPVTLEEMPYLMDRFSVRPIQQGSSPDAQLIPGLININTAPYRVLLTIPDMTADAAAAIVAQRRTLDEKTLATTAWPLTLGLVDLGTFKKIAPAITTKAYQQRVEVVGYADHLKLVQRREWIIEQIGGIVQVKYTRDLTRLGLAWPIDDDTVVATTR